MDLHQSWTHYLGNEADAEDDVNVDNVETDSEEEETPMPMVGDDAGTAMGDETTHYMERHGLLFR
jgi:hypothetical protein